MIMVLALFYGRAWSQLPPPYLGAVFPAGGKVGQTIEVTVTGTELDSAEQLLFSATGLAAKPKRNAAGDPEPNRFIITISSNTPPGIVETRVVSFAGVSNPRGFVLGNLPELTEPSTNHSLAAAMQLPLDTTVNAQAEANSADYFRFTLSKGQRVRCRSQIAEIDSRLDPVLLLFNAAGREIARNRTGGPIDFIAPEAGEFVLQIHDLIYRGGPEFGYRLTITTGPQLDFALPGVVSAGRPEQLKIFGVNLPGARTMKSGAAELDIPFTSPAPDPTQMLRVGLALRPNQLGIDGIAFNLPGENTPPSNPLLLAVASVPTVSEKDPNDTPEQAQDIVPPCEIAGQLYPAGDRDWFSFSAKKGEVLWLEIFSQRLGAPASPFLLVQRVTKTAEGKETRTDLKEVYDSIPNAGTPEFNTASRDPLWRFEAPEDGRYNIQVRDLFNENQSNPACLYRLSIRRDAPDFRLAALDVAPERENKNEVFAWSTFLRRGERLPVKIIALRRDGFSGPIQLSVEGLPSGLRCSTGTIEPNQTAGYVMIEAETQGSSWAGPLRIFGEATVAGKKLRHPAQAGAILWNVPDNKKDPTSARLAQDFVVGMSGDESALLTLETPTHLEMSLGGHLQVPAQIRRAPEFQGKIKLKPAGAEWLKNAKEIEVAEKATNAVIDVDLEKVQIPPGSHRFFLVAETKGKHQRPAHGKVKKGDPKDVTLAAYSTLIELDLKAAPIILSIGQQFGPVSSGEKLEIPVKIQRLFQFADSVELISVAGKSGSELRAAKVTIPKDRAEGKLILETGPKTSVGVHEFIVKASMKFNNRELKLEQSATVKVVAPQVAQKKN